MTETFTEKARRVFEEYQDELVDPRILNLFYHCGRQMEMDFDSSTIPTPKDVVVAYEMLEKTRYMDLVQSRCYLKLRRYYCLAKVVVLCHVENEDAALVFKLGFTL